MIMEFSGDYAFLSNFYEKPFTDRRGIVYKTNEHYFQAMKMAREEDFQDVLDAPTPQMAKRIGRSRDMHSFWDIVKDDVMLQGLRLKFKDPELRAKLLATEDEVLIEGNRWHDNYFGHCICEKCDGKEKLNMLGKLLMQVREEIYEEAQGICPISIPTGEKEIETTFAKVFPDLWD